MKSKSGKGNVRKSGQSIHKPRLTLARLAVGIVALVLSGAGIVWLRSGRIRAPETYLPRRPGQLTFNKEIAPILFRQCADCHRPGQSAPFSLLSYQDVKKHAADVATVTARRYMPPWLPEQGYGEFADERRLSVDEIGLIQQWVAEGAAEGKASDLPSLPQWNSDWRLGEPDLVVTMPQPYTLAADGRDVYRNFLLRVPISARRYVQGIEFQPGNLKIVHHAFVRVDATGQSRRLDEEDAEMGFPGMSGPAEMPGGQMLGWQPGRLPRMGPPGLPWPLEPGSDLVLQMHLNPSGKPELLQPKIGLFFTDRPPTNTCFKIVLTSLALDIPAGATNYAVEDNFVMPVDVEVLAVLPHAHYLAREMQGWATLPDGTQQWLLYIKQWDFNWQGDYRYAKPLFLPKGSTLSMRFTYDNSTNNVRNPNHPPVAVAYGPQSKDEMAELWFQVLPRHRQDLARLARDYELKLSRLMRESVEHALRRNPNSATAHTEFGMILTGEGRLPEAEQHFRAAILMEPDLALPHYHYGVLLRKQGRLAEARAQFREDLRLNPKDFKARGNLGSIFMQEGNLEAARIEYELALQINPEDAFARGGLEEIINATRGPGKKN